MKRYMLLLFLSLSILSISFVWECSASAAKEQPVSPGLLGGLTGLVNSVTETLKPVTQTVDTVLTPVVEPVLSPVTETLKPVTQTVNTVLKPVVEPVLTTVTDTLMPVTQTVDTVLKPVVEPVLTTVTDTLVPVTETVSTVLTPVVEPVLTTVTDALVPVTQTVGAVLTPVVEPVLTTVTDVLVPVTETVGKVLTPVVESVSLVLTPVVKPALTTVTNVLKPVTETVGTVLAPVVEPITTVPVVEPPKPQGKGNEPAPSVPDVPQSSPPTSLELEASASVTVPSDEVASHSYKPPPSHSAAIHPATGNRPIPPPTITEYSLRSEPTFDSLSTSQAEVQSETERVALAASNSKSRSKDDRVLPVIEREPSQPLPSPSLRGTPLDESSWPIPLSPFSEMPMAVIMYSPPFCPNPGKVSSSAHGLSFTGILNNTVDTKLLSKIRLWVSFTKPYTKWSNAPPGRPPMSFLASRNQ